jgi:AcrR family transcriptional regulator
MNDHHQADPSLSGRKERRHRETREEILREAHRLVEERGANNLSMRDLAKNTQFTPPALYRYFPGGKDDVLEALANAGLELLAEHFKRVPVDLPPRERLLELAMTYLEFAREHQQELDIMLESVGALQGRDLDEEGFLGPAGIFAIIEQAVVAGAEGGVLKASTPAEIALIFHGAWSLLHGMAVLERLHPSHETLFRVHARDLVQAFLNGFATTWIEPKEVPACMKQALGKDKP